MTFTRGIYVLAGVGLAVLLSSCGDGPPPNNASNSGPSGTANVAPPQNSPTTDATPRQPGRFDRASYSSLDGKNSVTLVSPTELEYRTGGRTFACQYTRDEAGRIRAVVEANGTKTVEYFSEIPDGLVSEDGTRYYTAAALDRAILQAKTDEL